MRADPYKMRIAMARRCLSCREIAEKARVHEKTVLIMLRGQNVTIKTFGLICQGMGVDPAEVVADEQDGS